MKKAFYSFLLSWIAPIIVVGSSSTMYHWTAHLAYNATTQVELIGSTVYALADGSLYTIDVQSEELITWSKLTGLNGALISAMKYNEATKSLIVVYQDGLIDILKGNNIYCIADLNLREMSVSKIPNSIYSYGSTAYLAMPFGIVCINMRKREIGDTYYVGENSKDVNVLSVTIKGDSIYAVGENTLFSAHLNANLNDYNNWQRSSINEARQILTMDETLWLLADSVVYTGAMGQWEQVYAEQKWMKMILDDKTLYLINAAHEAYEVTETGLQALNCGYWIEDIQQNGSTYWIACGGNGVLRYSQGSSRFYHPNSPISSTAYRMKIAGGKLYVLSGGRWAERYARPGNVMIYDGFAWSGISWGQIGEQTGYPALDMMNVAVDPANNEHYFVTSYGTGLYEFEGLKLKRFYNHTNSPLVSLGAPKTMFLYIRTDAALYDENRYLWFINCSDENYLHIVPPDSLSKYKDRDTIGWYRTTPKQNGSFLSLATPGEMFIDKQNSNYKWIPACRNPAGIILFDDHGTPLNSRDDRAYKRTSFTDQDNKVIRPERLYAVVQDANNDIWVGYDDGTFVIRSGTDFFQSDVVERVKIPRNDGTNLADYLLSGEQVNAIAIDGSNRKWIGTASSGVYLMSSDGVETIEHFTVDNSPLLSNEVLSIAIHPTTGEVFIGTGLGLVSYQSDATEPKENFNEVYAYPNPVRPEYEGCIAIKGLMNETVVYILDSGGNLVCRTQSNGGTAVWDGRNARGEKVPAGVYNVLCNTADGANHCVTKILVIH